MSNITYLQGQQSELQSRISSLQSQIAYNASTGDVNRPGTEAWQINNSLQSTLAASQEQLNVVNVQLGSQQTLNTVAPTASASNNFSSVGSLNLSDNERVVVSSALDSAYGRYKAGVPSGTVYTDGTNDPVRPITNTQNVPEYDSNGREAGGYLGVGAGRDDSGTRTATKQVIDLVNQQVVYPKPNILTQYASYTYHLSWYLMMPDQFNDFLNGINRNPASWQLLCQSGGAPTSTGATYTAPTNVIGGELDDIDANNVGVDQSTLKRQAQGRNEFFTNDYFIDDLELTSAVAASSGTRAAHNVTSLMFKVHEPYGVTLVNNLYYAVKSAYANNSIVEGQPNFATGLFLMVVRFYGYDENGQLMFAGKDNPTGRAIVEKYIPFQISGSIAFSLTSKGGVEYVIRGAPPASRVGLSRTRGVIPENIELSGSTVRDILIGQGGASGNGNANNNIDGRRDSRTPPSTYTPSATPVFGDTIGGELRDINSNNVINSNEGWGEG